MYTQDKNHAKMPPLLTPTTAYLNSCLDLSPFASPPPTLHASNGGEGVFFQPFSDFNGVKNDINGLACASKGRQPGFNQSDIQCVTPPQNNILPMPDGVFGNTYDFGGLFGDSPESLQYSYGHLPQDNMVTNLTIEGIREIYGSRPAPEPHGVPPSSLGSEHTVAQSEFSEDHSQSSRFETPLATKPKVVGRPRKNLTAEQREKKREAFLERNRVAAGKCRQRKKRKVENLEEQCRDIRKLNAQLKCEKEALMAQIEELKSYAFSDCTCIGGGSTKNVNTAIDEEHWEEAKGGLVFEDTDTEEMKESEVIALRKDSGYSDHMEIGAGTPDEVKPLEWEQPDNPFSVA